MQRWPVLDADNTAFSAVRVMVNMNQTGEAAGVASAIALQNGIPIPGVEASALRKRLASGNPNRPWGASMPIRPAGLPSLNVELRQKR